jgi:hypothetical protein
MQAAHAGPRQVFSQQRFGRQVHEYSGVAEVAVASDPTHGPLIAAVTDSGELLVKEGSLTASWDSEHSDTSQVAVAG